jgi:hypothetical protein
VLAKLNLLHNLISKGLPCDQLLDQLLAGEATALQI